MCKLPSLKLVHSNPPLGVLKRSVRSDIESGPRLRSGILGACAVAALAAILPSSFWPFDAVPNIQIYSNVSHGPYTFFRSVPCRHWDMRGALQSPRKISKILNFFNF